ncbi:hypothetical protein D7Z26_26900 [Cohnella endophytica]|uniref:Uncharacterized protein n=1 Tax=Cohnella endophytica TaxID=2419778 RepID=A0A494X7K8_9BACL|nr:hypothetical protein D7Z26_26900 [Cohnella endophytica]
MKRRRTNFDGNPELPRIYVGTPGPQMRRISEVATEFRSCPEAAKFRRFGDIRGMRRDIITLQDENR